jgi:hypothetical protein
VKSIAFIAALLFAVCAPLRAQDVESAGTRFHFASAAETRRLATTDDDWTATAGPFHRAAAVGRASLPVSDQAFKAALAATALDCTPALVQRWTAAANAAAPKLAQLHVKLPANVTIACTNGKDGSESPHTRADTVFLPVSFEEPHVSDTELMAHELFHIWSRHHPAEVSSLYALMGFVDAPELAWPAEWQEGRLSNPDAPHNRHAIRIETTEGAYTVMPVLVARRIPNAGELIFPVMDVRLLAVEPSGDGKSMVPVRRDGQPLWFPAFRTQSYIEQLGGNTPYIIHPEEAMADNVAYLVSGRKVPNTALMGRIRETLVALPLANTKPSPQ